jgi:hypothetical protein
VERAEQALGLSGFEARQRVKRGGVQLHRILPREEAGHEARRIRELGIAAFTIPEAEVRQAAVPLLALGGGFEAGALRLRTEKAELTLAPDDLLLVVRGPIARAYQARDGGRRLRSQAPDQGHRIHLHRRSELRPVELDPGDFAFGPLSAAAGLARLVDWCEALRAAAGVDLDDDFRLLAPALGPAAAGGGEVALAARALGAPRAAAARGGQAPLVLDNLAQFRFHSAWRGSWQRRRAAAR